MNPTIKYLNADLDLLASFDLRPLARALESRGIFVLHVDVLGDGSWMARMESDESFVSAADTVSALLTSIESLDSGSLELWKACAQRHFDLGYDCGEASPCFNDELPVNLLARMAALRISLRITLYPNPRG